MMVLQIIAFTLIAMAASFVLLRLVFGPTTEDRIVSADALALIATVVLLCLSMFFESSLYLDIALVYSVLSFVGIVALAKVIESKVSSAEKEDKKS
ncbi:MAG TPA: monovalent cation/H+ antiporter complex subunit F [Gammaproteobacteria bacterium]|nr:hypothetical protein [Xanthomonadales bacterium]HOP22886.1 monovalent cation/H+ antiporter complex subunit F [Gammaproteobacteria bacterium]HPI95109.1 monovalent cation/H+ antiporter complex subunit F [Gammaproteobacteria bacterium]